MEIKYLNTEEILEIHDSIIKESGGYSGIISYSNLDFVTAQARIPKTMERVSATLFYGILTSHPFVDGNKRTVIVATETFLKENGKEFLAEDEELWDIVHKVAEAKLKFEEVVIWIKKKISDVMVRKSVIQTAEKIIQKRIDLLRKLAEEQKYLKK